MNLYLSAIGFSDMDSMKESRFIKAAVRQCIDEGYILKGRPMIAPTHCIRSGRTIAVRYFYIQKSSELIAILSFTKSSRVMLSTYLLITS